jgi:hypothetical protein
LDDSLRDEVDQGQEPADAGQPYSRPGVWPQLLQLGYASSFRALDRPG